MLSFNFILIAAAAFASTVSAVPTPEIGNSLNIAQRSPGGLPIVGSITGTRAVPVGSASEAFLNYAAYIENQEHSRLSSVIKKGKKLLTSLFGRAGGLAVGGNPPAKRGGSSGKEVIQKCHDDIADIVVKIS